MTYHREKNTDQGDFMLKRAVRAVDSGEPLVLCGVYRDPKRLLQ